MLELSQLTHWFGEALFPFSRVAPKKHREGLVQIIEPNTQDVATFRLAQLQLYSPSSSTYPQNRDSPEKKNSSRDRQPAYCRLNPNAPSLVISRIPALQSTDKPLDAVTDAPKPPGVRRLLPQQSGNDDPQEWEKRPHDVDGERV